MNLLTNSRTFEKVLLHFDKMRDCLKWVRTTYQEFAGKDGLNVEGIQKVMDRLHVSLGPDDVVELFNYIDMNHDSMINFKEFLIALTVEYVFGNIPFNKTSNLSSDEVFMQEESQVLGKRFKK